MVVSFFLFSPLLGEDSDFDEYFSDGLKPPTSNVFLMDAKNILADWQR